MRAAASHLSVSLAFFQRACTALRAISLRCSEVSLAARAFPPFRPSDTAAGFFRIFFPDI